MKEQRVYQVYSWNRKYRILLIILIKLCVKCVDRSGNWDLRLSLSSSKASSIYFGFDHFSTLNFTHLFVFYVPPPLPSSIPLTIYHHNLQKWPPKSPTSSAGIIPFTCPSAHTKPPSSQRRPRRSRPLRNSQKMPWVQKMFVSIPRSTRRFGSRVFGTHPHASE